MKKQLLTAGFVLFSAMMPLKAIAANFTSLNIISDSLSETGNVFTATGGQIPPATAASGQAAYFNGRFSNGPSWVDYFGEQQGLTPTPFTQVSPSNIPTQGVNFAFGAARTGLESTIAGTDFTVPGVLGQVGLLQQNFAIDPNGIYAIWGGANDYFSFTPVTEVVGNLSFSIDTLAQAGAQNILAFNLPDLSLTPFAQSDFFTPEQRQDLRDLTNAHNQQLALLLNSLRSQYPQTNIFSVDIATLFDTASKSPAEFGFQNVEGACAVGNFLGILTVCENPDEFLFFDDIHPTSRTHQLIAQAALRAVHVPEPSGVLGLLALGALGAATIKRKQKQSALTATIRIPVSQASHTKVGT
ncbi:MAG: SGNH/GDSL hydrolase family protein [Nostocaceae cyanobacterium]|nr:SGNH/GDSL hydrolase family protein [Nostocaceae cyanobacterium]